MKFTFRRQKYACEQRPLANINDWFNSNRLTHNFDESNFLL